MKFRLAICTAMSLALSFGAALPGQADDSHGWLGTETVKTVRRLRVQERLSDAAAADALLDQLKFNRAVEVYLAQMPTVAIIECGAA